MNSVIEKEIVKYHANPSSYGTNVVGKYEGFLFSVNVINRIKGIKNSCVKDLLIYILEIFNPLPGHIELDKRSISELLGYSKRTVHDAIEILIEKEYLYRSTYRGIYFINFNIFNKKDARPSYNTG